MTDRRKAPEIQNITSIEYPKAEKSILSNGLPVFYINAPSQEVVKIDFIFEAGAWQQDEHLISVLTSYMMQEGTENYSSVKIAGIFDFYGAYIQSGADQDFATVSIICLNKYLSEIMKVTEDILKRPVFPQQELDVLLERQKQRFRLGNEKVNVLCQKKFTTVLFGEKHPYAVNNRIEDFDAISCEKLLMFYKKWYHSGNCRIIVAGNINEEVCSLIEKHFGSDDWKSGRIPQKEYMVESMPERRSKISKANALQTAIRVGRLWVDKKHPDYCGLSVLLTIFGGYFGSRLMMNLREEKGYTYGISSSVFNFKGASYMTISTEVGNSYTGATLSEINKEMKCLRDEPVPPAELDMVKSFLLGEFLRDFDGPFALSSGFKAINDFGLDYDFYDHYLEILNNITAEEIQRLANKYLLSEEMYTVTAGS